MSRVTHPIIESVKLEPFEVKLPIQVSIEAWGLFAFLTEVVLLLSPKITLILVFISARKK